MYFAGKNTLLEISAVPVPANGEALAMRSLGHEVRHVLNVEETDEAYIVTYAKMPEDDAPADDEDEIEAEAFGDEDEDEPEDEAEGYGEDDEDEDKEHEPGHDEDEDDEDDDEGDGEPVEDDEDEDDEDEAKAMRNMVRDIMLELMGHNPKVRKALRNGPRKQKRTRSDGVTDLFGIDI